MKLVDAGDFQGRYKEAAALSHAEVDENPLSFFVVNEKIKRQFQDNKVIINPRIVNQNNPVTFTEACMGYPNHKEKTVNRYNEVTLTYQIPTWYGGLKTVTQYLKGIPAFIAQHQVDHNLGVHIYDS